MRQRPEEPGFERLELAGDRFIGLPASPLLHH
jgi:hypothetical protein